jgi:DNA-binding HxlR family transcriptional regulator
MWKPVNQSKRSEIIYGLIREGNKPKRFEELRKLCMQELKSRTTFNLYLTELVKKGIVTRTVRSRKNVLYQLNTRNPEVRALIKHEKLEEKPHPYLNVNSLLPKWPKPTTDEERRAQYCETLVDRVAGGFDELEHLLFTFVEHRVDPSILARVHPNGISRSYLEYQYYRLITRFFKVLTSDLERLYRRDPKLFKHARTALSQYRHETCLTGRLLYELTELERADASNMKPGELSAYERELAERIQRIYGSRNWLRNGPYAGSRLLRKRYVRDAIVRWMNTEYEDWGT